MKIRSLLVKMLPVILLTSLLVLSNAENALGLPETLLLIDEFDGNVLDTGLWNFKTHSNNNAQAVVSGGLLTIHSGVVNGSGGTVISNQSFTLSEDILVLEMRAYVGSDNFGGSWGFEGPRSDPNRGHLRFGIWQPDPGYLMAIIRPGDSSNPILIDLSQVDPTVWHTYRIEATDNIARFYVDDVLVTTFSGLLPVGVPLHIDLDSASHGSDERLIIDYVKLTRETPFRVYLPLILRNFPKLFFFEDFNDGELITNPFWNVITNDAYAIFKGQLHSDGLNQDQSDRYRNVYRSDVSFQAPTIWSSPTGVCSKRWAILKRGGA